MFAAASAQAGPVEAVSAPKSAEESLLDYNRARLKRGVEAMTALTVWGGLNTLAGAIGWPLSKDTQWQAFHGMNLGWGTVNLAIAIPSLVRNLAADPAEYTLVQTLKAEQSLQISLIVNLGLDVAYLTAGALLWERGDFGGDPLLTGFGQSLIIQGAFLLAFDIVYYVISADISASLYSRVRDGGLEVGLVGRF